MGGGRLLWRCLRLCSPVCTAPGHGGPTFKGAVFRPLSSPGYDLPPKELPPVLDASSVVSVRFHPRPRVGPFRCPPLRCRGKALAGSGGRYVSRRRVALGVGSPCKRGSVPVGIHLRRFTRPVGRDPCGGLGGGLQCERACQCLAVFVPPPTNKVTCSGR